MSRRAVSDSTVYDSTVYDSIQRASCRALSQASALPPGLRWTRPIRPLNRTLGAGLLAVAALASQARDAAPLAVDPALEARVMEVAEELRCLVCQNETIAASQADLAVDLRQQIRNRLGRGESKAQILDFMVQRYGAFVRYRPALNATTALLWVGPFALLAAAAVALATIIRRHRPARLDARLGAGDEGDDLGAADEADRRIDAARSAADRIDADGIDADRTDADRIAADRIDADGIDADRISVDPMTTGPTVPTSHSAAHSV